jgi:hypothetical protein
MAIRRSAEDAGLPRPPESVKKQKLRDSTEEELVADVAIPAICASSSSSASPPLSPSRCSIAHSSSSLSSHSAIHALLSCCLQIQGDPIRFKEAFEAILNHPEKSHLSNKQARELFSHACKEIQVGLHYLSIFEQFFIHWPAVFSENTLIPNLDFFVDLLPSLWRMHFDNPNEALIESDKRAFATILKALPLANLIALYTIAANNWSLLDLERENLGVFMVETPEIFNRIPLQNHGNIVLNQSLSLNAFKELVDQGQIDRITLEFFLVGTCSFNDPQTAGKRLHLIKTKKDLFTDVFLTSLINKAQEDGAFNQFTAELLHPDVLKELPFNFLYHLVKALYISACPELREKNGPPFKNREVNAQPQISQEQLLTLLKSHTPPIQKALLKLARTLDIDQPSSTLPAPLLSVLQNALIQARVQAQNEIKPLVLGLIDRTSPGTPTALQRAARNNLFEPRLINLIGEFLGAVEK